MLGGLSTIFTLQGLGFPSKDKLLMMQLKGIERNEPPKSVSATITPHMWFHIWTHGLLHEAPTSLVQTFVAVVLLQYFGWRVGTVLRLTTEKARIATTFISFEASHCKNTSNKKLPTGVLRLS